MASPRLHNILATQFPALVVGLGLFSGCASIISGRYADVSIASNPPNAHVAIRDDANREVAAFHTPGVAKLRRNRKFFMPARYTATIEAPGHAPAQVPIRSEPNPWVLGNILVGAVPGLIVDGATGALWQPSPAKIEQQLIPLQMPQPYPVSWPPPPTVETGGQ
jgi:hypothetical protein